MPKSATPHKQIRRTLEDDEAVPMGIPYTQQIRVQTFCRRCEAKRKVLVRSWRERRVWEITFLGDGIIQIGGNPAFHIHSVPLLSLTSPDLGIVIERPSESPTLPDPWKFGALR